MSIDTSAVIHELLEIYNIDDVSTARPFGSGLINNTWKIEGKKEYILQRINTKVFRQPERIASNIRLISNFFKLNHPSYFFIAPLVTEMGEDMVFIKDAGYFRIFPFVDNSVTHHIVENSKQANEAAKQFGKFTRLLENFPSSQLEYTIPDFHNLPLRYHQFLQVLNTSDDERKKNAKLAIELVIQYEFLVKKFSAHLASDFQLRVMHHDTKISNVLFDKADNGICVIDLDTVMPGYFFSDVGDMIRTYVPTVNEEETDLSKIEVRKEIYKAIAEGYLSEMGGLLTPSEKISFKFAGMALTFMQAIRFLTDYLQNDIYYVANSPTHNLDRARNQLVLLEKLDRLE